MDARPQAHPAWVRLFASFAFLLMLFGSTAQAGHVHGEWLPHAAAQAATHLQGDLSNDSEANCPLCTVMHSALPAGVAMQVAAAVPVARISIAAQPARAVPRLDLPHLSRPPPSHA